MAKVLIYDFDKGLSSIGSDERIKEVFGYLPRRFIRCQSAIDLFEKTHKPSVIRVEDALGTTEQESYTIDPKLGIDFEVLDSITAWQAQKKREVKGKASKITLNQWGDIGEAVEDLVFRLTRTDTNIIVTGHTKTEKDDNAGILRFIPALSGRMKDEIARHFDIVAYTRAIKEEKKGTTSYFWQLTADESHAAKCRLETVSDYIMKSNGLIAQDYGLLWSLVKKGGYKAVKMLVLGEAGTGKTFSLRTLKNV